MHMTLDWLSVWEREIQMGVKTITFDASTKAIGWSVYDDKRYIASGAYVIEDKSLQNTERVANMFEYINSLHSILSRDFPDHTRVVLNLGFQQANGISEGTRYLQRVQHYLALRFCDLSDTAHEFAVLDISWLGVLHRLSGFRGNENQLKVRKTKKFETVKVASWIKYGKDKVKEVVIKAGEWYIISMLDGTKIEMSDDEADAILCGWSFVSGQLSDQLFFNAKEKNKQKKMEDLNKGLAKLIKTMGTLDNKIAKLKDDRELILKKPDTKTKENSLELNSVKMDDLLSNKQELQMHIDKQERLIREEKSK